MFQQSTSALWALVHAIERWRIIVDLSSPTGHSVNDGVAGDVCSLSYLSIDNVVDIIISLCQDVSWQSSRHQTSLLPVHPQDWFILGVFWQGEVFVDRTLPFGLSSAPKLFSAVTDSLAWALHCKGVPFQLHYLDDFCFWAKQASTPVMLLWHLLSICLHILASLWLGIK